MAAAARQSVLARQMAIAWQPQCKQGSNTSRAVFQEKILAKLEFGPGHLAA
jgi:hypothetical protein